MKRFRRVGASVAIVVATVSTIAAATTDGFRPIDVFDETLREAWPAGSSPSGSGFSVGPRHVVTAAHVIAGCRVMWVQSNALRQTSAKILGLDTRADVALLQVSGPTEPWRTSPAAARPGEPLMLHGFPQRKGKVARTPSESAMVDATEVADDLGGRILEMVGSGPEGVSGGPVTNAAGAVVGMVVARRHGAEDRILAIPAERVAAFLAYMGIDWRGGATDAAPTDVGRTEPGGTPWPAPRPSSASPSIETFRVGCSR